MEIVRNEASVTKAVSAASVAHAGAVARTAPRQAQDRLTCGQAVTATNLAASFHKAKSQHSSANRVHPNRNVHHAHRV